MRHRRRRTPSAAGRSMTLKTAAKRNRALSPSERTQRRVRSDGRGRRARHRRCLRLFAAAAAAAAVAARRRVVTRCLVRHTSFSRLCTSDRRPSTRPSIRPPVRPPACPPARPCLSVRPSVRPPARPPTRSVRRSVHPPARLPVRVRPSVSARLPARPSARLPARRPAGALAAVAVALHHSVHVLDAAVNKVRAVFVAHFLVHVRHDLRRQLEAVDDLVLPLVDEHPVLWNIDTWS